MKKNFLIILLPLVLLACESSNKIMPSKVIQENIISGKKPKNIILMIGDGMGISQITAGMYQNGNTLHLEGFPVVGMHKSYAADNLITDSAAGATAFACGQKTYNGAVAVDRDSLAMKTILEEAEDHQLATGLVATSTIVHATPASFIAHVNSRYKYEEIAPYFLETEVEYFVGGGKKYFNQRADNKNLLEVLQQKDYAVFDYSKEKLAKSAMKIDKKIACFTHEDSPEPYAKGRDYLVPASKQAPLFLNKKSEKGFFLMIEGSQIDWGGHDNDSEYIISEMIDFDNAIGTILDFAKTDGETLVIVTADHETGGYAINKGSTLDTIIGRFTTGDHTAALIPVFAYGPGSEIFSGIYENTAIYDKMKVAFGF